jgi:uncharacterized protein (TIGR00730 family)
MKICVFCGSSTGLSPVFAEAARNFGALLAKNSITLIYGGGNVGLMGILADTVMANSGEVIGVIPDFLLKKEVGHKGITKLEIVESMHQRKKRMADLADAFIALPGGWGTLEELSEVLTWRQLHLIRQPVGVLNVGNFFGPLLDQMRLMAEHGFLKPDFMNLLHVEDTAEKLLHAVSKQQVV